MSDETMKKIIESIKAGNGDYEVYKRPLSNLIDIARIWGPTNKRMESE